jgi:ribosomal protein S1
MATKFLTDLFSKEKNKIRDAWDTLKTPFKKKITVKCKICGRVESECPACGNIYTNNNTEVNM